MPMRGLRGDTWTAEQVNGFAKGKIKDLDKLIEDLSPWKVLPDGFKPKATIYEAEAARRAFGLLIKGDTEKAKSYLACLPTAIGRVNLYVNEFLVHLGWAWTHVNRQNKVVRVALVREIGLMDPWAWDDIFTAMKAGKIKLTGVIESDQDLKNAFMEQGWELKTSGTGWISCPGWSELQVEFEDETDPRTYKKLKVGTHHECGVEMPANEPFHRIRCKECRDTLESFRGVGKTSKGMSKGKTEKFIFSELFNLLKDQS